MDGLYSYHDRAEEKIGLAVAYNCPNSVKSSKNNADDWCSCFSSTLKTNSSWSLYVPWGTGCFFWQWWMFVVMFSLLVVLACVVVLIWWQRTNKQMKQLQEEAYRSGSVGSHTARLPSTRSSRGAALAPAPPPSRYFVVSTPARKTQSTGSMLLPTKSHDKRSIRKEEDLPYSNLNSPRSLLSSTSSIALLSEAAYGSNSSKESWRRTSNRPYQGNRVYASHNPYPIHSDDRWGVSLK
ncbi:hypothetical protein PsorP6_018235 [Peronosclerospora sorghi]|uniref:Uncharacterized protein n=1 Tax=Peronosclerospora sorghi TaxID=230839 RepID=A0ACC0WH72_9STRA|nr:hypothetical protein PsorP6_018235 [Peronosclerospora sorghi]